MVALLMFAVGCAFGLFFGWLLHRERVERALYEDVVRTRDRATGTLAETSARLELANKDMVRLRDQLTNTQHLLRERDATISDLEDELASLEAPAEDLLGHEPHEAIDGAADAATTPDDIRLFDDDGLDDETDITEEVPIIAAADTTTTAPDVDELVVADRQSDEDELVVADQRPDVDELVETDETGATVDGDDVGAHAVVAVESGAAAEPAGAVEQVDAAGPADIPERGPADAGDEPADSGDTAAPAEDATEDEVDASGDVAEADPADEAASPAVVVAGHEDDAGAADAEIGAPLVLDVEAPPAPGPASTAEAADELQRISGVGPALERQLHAEGITTYRQLALLDDAALAELQARRPSLVTRMRRGGWAAQARRLHVETYGSQPEPPT